MNLHPSLHKILYFIALVLFIAAAIGWPAVRINLVAAGLACWVATKLW